MIPGFIGENKTLSSNESRVCWQEQKFPSLKRIMGRERERGERGRCPAKRRIKWGCDFVGGFHQKDSTGIGNKNHKGKGRSVRRMGEKRQLKEKGVIGN